MNELQNDKVNTDPESHNDKPSSLSGNDESILVPCWAALAKWSDDEVSDKCSAKEPPIKTAKSLSLLRCRTSLEIPPDMFVRRERSGSRPSQSGTGQPGLSARRQSVQTTRIAELDRMLAKTKWWRGQGCMEKGRQQRRGPGGD